MYSPDALSIEINELVKLARGDRAIALKVDMYFGKFTFESFANSDFRILYTQV